MYANAQTTRLKGNRGRGTPWWRQILDQKWKYGGFANVQWKKHYNPYLLPNRRNFCVFGHCGHGADTTFHIERISSFIITSTVLYVSHGDTDSYEVTTQIRIHSGSLLVHMATSVPKVISRCYQQLRFQREIPGSETNDKLRMTEEWGDERRVEAGAQPRLKN